MQEQQGQEKWSKGNEPFMGSLQKYRAVKKEDRAAYIKEKLEVKQMQGPPPVLFIKQYTDSGKFTYEGYQLHYHCIRQTDSPKAIVIHVHGLNSHGGTSGYFASVVTKKNPDLNFYSFDQMNFGQSQGPYRGEIASIEDTIKQVDAFITYLFATLKSKPKIFLSGSSYGGTVIFKLGLLNPEKYAGMIFLAPALRNLNEHMWLAKKFGKMIGFIFPRSRLFKDKFDSGTKYNQRQRIEKDPYVYNDGAVPGSIRVILNSMDEVSTQYKEFNVPYILFQAGVEKLVDPFAPLDLQDQCQTKDKTTIYCEKMWHAVMGQEQIEGISWKSAEWLKERI